jgi:hypothetical protein
MYFLKPKVRQHWNKPIPSNVLCIHKQLNNRFTTTTNLQITPKE